MTYRKWPIEEIEFIRDNYKKLGAAKIAKKFDRPSRHIRSQYARLKKNGFKIRKYLYTWKPFKFPDLSPSQLGYIAGFLDGEGCFSLQIIRRGGIPHYCVPAVTVYNKDPKSIEYIHDLLKLSKGLIHSNKGVDLSINGGLRIKEFLEHVLPYLVLKKEQANIMLQLLKQHRNRVWSISDWELVLKHAEANRFNAHPRCLARKKELREFIKNQKREINGSVLA